MVDEATVGRPVLELDLRWQAAGRWYGLQARCGSGLTVVTGPAASSLLRLLAGRPAPYRGVARLDRQIILPHRSPGGRPVTAVLADDALSLWRSPLGLVSAGVRAHGVPYQGARMRAAQALRWVGAEGPAYRPMAMLGAGERGRVVVAAALAKVPGLLLLERPAAALPGPARAELYGVIGHLAAQWETVALLIPDEAAGELPTWSPRLLE